MPPLPGEAADVVRGRGPPAPRPTRFQVAVIVATGGSIPILAAKVATSRSFMLAVPQGGKAIDLISMSALPHLADSSRTSREGREVPILLQKSPRESCRIETRNNRIETNGFLNQRCACAPDVGSMLLAQMRKIFLQQYLPRTDIPILGNPGALRRWRARRDSNRHRTNQLASTACAPTTRITPSAAASPSVLSRM
jgi:hypothetical protein